MKELKTFTIDNTIQEISTEIPFTSSGTANRKLINLITGDNTVELMVGN